MFFFWRDSYIMIDFSVKFYFTLNERSKVKMKNFWGLKVGEIF